METTKLNKRGAIAIAKDVLKIIGKIKTIEKGTYCSIRPTQRYHFPDNGPLQDHLEEFIPMCSVCALGAMFLGYVDKYNKADLINLRQDGGIDSDFMREMLSPYFSEDNLSDIEYSFEIWGSRTSRLVDFGARFEDPKERLIAIMENIVENRGVFAP